MTAEIIPFPRREDATMSVEVLSVGDVEFTVQCNALMHYFTDRTKPCQCGEERWPKETA